MQAAPLVVVYYFSTFFLIRGALVNITVDDTLPNPDTNERLNYTSIWQVGRTCAGCTSRPSPTLAYLGSWHEVINISALSPSVATASFSFNGSALYVYGILNNMGSSRDFALNDLEFAIDGSKYGTYYPDDSTNAESGFAYNVLLFAVDSLPLRPHTLRLRNFLGPDGSVVFLDYVIYTTDDGNSSNSSQSPNNLPHPMIQPSTTQSSGPPNESAPSNPSAAPSAMGNAAFTAFVVSICTGSLLGTYCVWQAVMFFLRRRNIAVRVGPSSNAASTMFSSPPRPSTQTTEHNSPSTDSDDTLVSNVCVVRVDTDIESLGSRGVLSSLARRTEKWRTFIYGATRSSS